MVKIIYSEVDLSYSRSISSTLIIVGIMVICTFHLYGISFRLCLEY
jgi:hypothetical protein